MKFIQYKCLLCGEVINDDIDGAYSHLRARHCVSVERIIGLNRYIKCIKRESSSHRDFVEVGYTDDFWAKAVREGKIVRLSYHTEQRCQRCNTNVCRGYAILLCKGFHFICCDCKERVDGMLV